MFSARACFLLSLRAPSKFIGAACRYAGRECNLFAYLCVLKRPSYPRAVWPSQRVLRGSRMLCGDSRDFILADAGERCQSIQRSVFSHAFLGFILPLTNCGVRSLLGAPTSQKKKLRMLSVALHGRCADQVCLNSL